MEKHFHGLSHHPLYGVWKGMKQRCYNPKASRFEKYGGRGIKVCKQWKDCFVNFYNDMVEGYSKGLQLDRIDNDGNYCKENCRWVAPSENVKNRDCAIFYKGKNLKDYCKEKGLNYNTVFSRHKYYGWSLDKAVREGNFRGKRSI